MKTYRACELCGDLYQPYRDWQRACSRRCRDALPDRVETRRKHARRPEVRERKNAARRVTNDSARRNVNLRANLRRYGLTLEDYEQLLAEQGGSCAICGGFPDPEGVQAASRLHVDHCHESGRPRSLLCMHCNRGLGAFRDDPVLMQRAIAYLAGHALKEYA
jgi:hypothetical protein